MSWSTAAMRAVAVLVVYYLAARVGLVLQFAHSNVTPFWPPSGIAVASLFLLGLRYWPVFWIGAFLVNLTTPLTVPVAAVLAVGNTLEYLTAVFILKRTSFDPRMRELGDVVRLLAASVFAPPIAATIGTAGLLAGEVIKSADVATVWSVYYVGDGVGMLVFAALLVVWAQPFRIARPGTAAAVEATAFLLTVTAAASYVFVHGASVAYLIFPLSIWGAVRFGQRGATITVFVVTVLAVWGTVHGIGPFTQGSRIDRLAELQVFLAAFALSALALASTVLAYRVTENRLKRRTRQLEDTNHELESFAYTVSHDLRAPLRAIAGYAGAIIDDFAHSPPELLQYAGTVAKNAQSMGLLLDGLLEFSRIGPLAIRRTTVDPREIARQIVERLSNADPARNVKATVGNLPPCSADLILLTQVFENLLGNAFKFTRNRDPAVIEVGFTALDGKGGAYYVRDNGAGFDMRDVGKLFGVFSRLHTQAEFPGSGAGLAIVSRIVTKHGGRVWAEAEKGRGATFFFTIGAQA